MKTMKKTLKILALVIFVTILFFAVDSAKYFFGAYDFIKTGFSDGVASPEPALAMTADDAEALKSWLVLLKEGKAQGPMAAYVLNRIEIKDLGMSGLGNERDIYFKVIEYYRDPGITEDVDTYDMGLGLEYRIRLEDTPPRTQGDQGHVFRECGKPVLSGIYGPSLELPRLSHGIF